MDRDESKKEAMTYDASSIQILDGLEHVRIRPEMYIGDTGVDGLHHLLKEVVDNAVDEHLDGHVTDIAVVLDTETQTVEVYDNGRGIPVEVHEKAKIPTVTAVFTKLHAGGKFNKKTYTGAVVGLHGIGVKAVNALSMNLDVWTARDGKVHHQQFSRGEPQGGLVIAKRKFKRGTVVRFSPDIEVFGTAEFSPSRIAKWLGEISYLCSGLKISFIVDGGEPQIFFSKNGLRDLLDSLSSSIEASFLHDPLITKTKDFELALVWTDYEGEFWRSFVNVSSTPEHGTHVHGVKQSIMRTLNGQSKIRHRGEDLRDGLVAVVHAFVPEPKFRGQTKTRLENKDVSNLIADQVDEIFKGFMLNNKDAIKDILTRAGRLREARQKFRAQQKAIKGTKVARGARGILPGKLCEAPDAPSSERELFLVEGDSAFGTVRDARIQKKIRGRTVHFQEVFPLRGKLVNAARRDELEKVLKNEEIKNIVLALGTGVGAAFDLTRIRYRAIYILMDADPDGRHISALLLSFFAQFMSDLIAEDKLRVVLNPLFMGVSKDKRVYGDTIAAVKKRLGNAKYRIQRFKGLGESDAKDLRTYAMDPETRRVMRVQWDGEDDRQLVLRYMGMDSSARKEILNIIE